MMLRIKELRINAGLSRQQLADLSGVSRQTIENAESNEDGTTLKSLIKIAAALGVAVRDLFY